jgi:tripartite-type tricarboxylate transporter receptor subunit TctC
METNMFKRFTAVLCCLSFSAVFSAQAATSESYPSKPVRIIVPFPAGQATDLLARALGQQFTKSTGQSFYIDNKPGASAIIGVEAGKNAAPDGYTLVMASSGPLAINPTLYAKLPYDPIRDFQPVGMVAVVPQFLVTKNTFPAGDLNGIISYVKQNPGKVNFGSGGAGLTNHLTMEMLKSTTEMQMTHVPYKGAAAAVTALVSGEVDLMFESGPPVIPFIKRGQLKVIAVGSQKRSLALPDVPTVAELGVSGFAAQSWAALLAPTGTPREIVQKLNAELKTALNAPELKERFFNLGAEPTISTPDETAAYMKSEVQAWGKAVKASGARAD